MLKERTQQAAALADTGKAEIRRLRQKVARYEDRYEMISPDLFLRLDSGEIRLTAELDDWRRTCQALKTLLGEVDGDGAIVWLEEDETRWDKRHEARLRRLQAKKGKFRSTIKYTTTEARKRYLRRYLARCERRYEMSSEELVRRFDNDEIRPTVEIVTWYHNSYALKFILSEETHTDGTQPKTTKSLKKTG